MSTPNTPFVDWTLFPDFEKVLTLTSPEAAVPVFEKLLTDARDEFKRREQKVSPTYHGAIGQFDDIDERLSHAFGLLTHLNGVKNTAELRSTLQVLQPQYVQFGLQMSQSEPRYKALETLRQSSEWDHLDGVQKRVVQQTLLGMKQAGVGLEQGSPEKERFNAISERLSQLTMTFSNHVLDAVKAYKLYVSKDELSGCPETLLKTLEKNAQLDPSPQGDYCITLDGPVFMSFMMNCSNRALREKLYRANITKASENETVINEILTLRREKAHLLGYQTHAELSLEKKMAGKVDTAESLLQRLLDASHPHGEAELRSLTQFAEQQNETTPLQPWDLSFVSEQYRKALHKYDDEAIASYLPFPRVLQGLFDVASSVFGIQVRELSRADQKSLNITTWHDDVKVFEVSEDDQVRAYFYGDFYSRPSEKRGGAWMGIATTRRKHSDGSVTLPVAHLVCNQPPPTSPDTPSLMKFRDVETLFHEFGHGMQHMLTRVNEPQASGILGIEWDFVEVASQFMENFCREPAWLRRVAQHYETNQAMPDDMVEALKQRHTFLAGLGMLRQLHFAMLDLDLHARFTPPSHPDSPTVFDVDAKIAEKTLPMPRPKNDRFLCSFSHIFGGGYSAGYYSYKWSETYSADAYAAFEEAQAEGGEASIRAIGQRYRDTLLALGGGTAPDEVWEQFRGRRTVDVNALLRQTGLLA